MISILEAEKEYRTQGLARIWRKGKEKPMTRTERQDLLQICRQRERAAKSDAVAVAAKRKADFAAQLSADYSFDQDEVWNQAHAAAEEATQKAQEEVVKRCCELGIPRSFAPTLSLSWYGRGENASALRRAELIRVAHTKIDQLEKEARHEIARASVDIQTQLMAAGLESPEAKVFLDAMPTADQLMPAFTVEQAKKQLRRVQEARVELSRPN
jgi:hypothetical protein